MTSVPQENIFPDLHHKMSKKIAQLTKVIYHLNTKNDDHEFELQGLTTAYESEIDQILKDAYSKINEFRRQLELRKEQSKAAEQLQDFIKKQEEEKKGALSDIEEFKKKVKEHQDKLQKASERKIAELTKELEDVKMQFSDRLQSFADLTRTMDVTSNSALEELKKAHSKEISDLVKTSNKKYNDMLAEQMTLQEHLKSQFAADVVKERQKVEKDMQNALRKARAEEADAREIALNELRQQLSASAGQDLVRREQEWREKLQSSQSETEDLRRRERELQSSNGELVKKLDAAQVTIRNQVAELRGLQQRAETSHLSQEQQNAHLQASLKAREEDILGLHSQLGATQAQLASAQKEMEETRPKLAQHSSMLQDANVKLSSLQREREAVVRDRDELRDKLAASAEDIKRLRQQITATDAALQTRAEEAEKIRKDAEQWRRSSEKNRRDADAALQELEVLRRDAAGKQGDLSSKLENMRVEQQRRLQELEAQHAKGIEEMQKAATKQLQDVEDKHTKTVKELERAAAAKSKENEELLRGEMKKMEVQYQERLGSLQAQHRDILSKLQHDSKAQVEAVQQQLADLERERSRMLGESTKAHKDMADNAANAQRAIQGLEGKLKGAEQDKLRLEEKMRVVETALETSRGEARSAQDKALSLSRELERARQTMDDNDRAARANLEAQLRDANDRWQRSLEGSTAATRSRLVSEHNRAMEKLAADKDVERTRMEQELKDQIRNLHAEVHRLRTALDAAQEAGRDLTLQNTRAIDQLNEERVRVIEQMRREHEAEVQRLKADSTSETHAVLARLRVEAADDAARVAAKHTAELTALHNQSQAQLQQLAAQHEAAIRSKDDELRRQLEDARKAAGEATEDSVRAENARMREERDRLLADAAKKHKAALDERQVAIASLNAEVRQKDASMDALRRQLADVESKRKALEAEVEKRSQEIVRTRQDLERELESRLAAAEQRHKRDSELMLEEQINQTRALNAEFTKAGRLMDEKHAALERKYFDLEARFLNREPRQEDLDRIRELEAANAEYEKRIKDVQDEMRYFKLELINRETNYNKLFGRQPTVGVVDPLRGKAQSFAVQPSQADDKMLPPLGGSAMEKEAPQRKNWSGSASSSMRRESVPSAAPAAATPTPQHPPTNPPVPRAQSFSVAEKGRSQPGQTKKY